MAAVQMTCVRLTTSINNKQVVGKLSTPKLVLLGRTTTGFPCLRTSRIQISCEAKPNTVDKVCEIVKDKLALPADSVVAPDSKFSTLGGSNGTVDIGTILKEFGIGIEEQISQNITTVQEAADYIEKLIEKKTTAANEVLEELVEKTNTTKTNITENLVESKDTITTNTNDVIKDLVEKTNTTATDLTEKLVEKKDAATTMATDVIEKLVETKDAAATTTSDVIENFVDNTNTTKNDLIEKLVEKKDATTTYVNEKIDEKKDTMT